MTKSDILQKARSILEGIPKDDLVSAGLWRDRFSYELVYNYPPARILLPMQSFTVFPATLASHAPDKSIGLYIHIPFCKGRCSFCHYLRYTNSRKELVDIYLDSILGELKLLSETPSLKHASISSIHVGGGTPTILYDLHIAAFMNFARNHFKIMEAAEITFESSPETIIGENSSKLQTLLRNGVNRLNIGVQAFDDRLLALCGRRHTASDAEFAIRKARDAGFVNINIDVIYGLPDQDLKDWQRTLVKIEELRPESVTIYNLRIFHGTRFAKFPPNRFPSEYESLLMQIYGYESLKYMGYSHLQPCQFVLSSSNVHQYVIDKWEKGGEFLGVGMSSYGYINDCLYVNHRTLEEYKDSIRRNEIPVCLGIKLTQGQRRSKAMILGLKVLPVGVNCLEFRSKFGMTTEEAFGDTLAKLENLGLLERSADKIRLSPRGILFSDEVCVEFYTPEDKIKLRQIGSSKYGCYLPY